VRWTLALLSNPSAVLALGQRDELREVLLNLLENARLAQAKHVEVRVGLAAAGATIDVEDDGLGIAPDVLPRVFEPHFSTRTSGSGLGLAISRRLIESWGGRISVDSTPGHGTVVHVWLRLAGG
jgi:signal transduction histidine kinase